MKKILAFSILMLLSMFSYAVDQKSIKEDDPPQNVQAQVDEMLTEMKCGPSKNLNEFFKKNVGMYPLLVTHSDKTGMSMVVFNNPRTEDTITVKVNGDVACIISSGTDMILKYNRGMSM